MAQGKVTDFFATRKRNAAAQPSKRRKIEITSSEVDVDELTKTNINPYKNVEQEKESHESVDQRKENSMFSPLQTRAGRKAKSLTISTPKPSTRTRKAKIDSSQKLIADAFVINPKAEGLPKSDPSSGQGLVTDTVTSSWDDHDGMGPPGTPTKTEPDPTSNARKRGRLGKTSKKISDDVSGEATPEKCKPSKTVANPDRKSRKCLQLKLTQSSAEEKSVTNLPSEGSSEFSLPRTPPPVSPLPPTPEDVRPAATKTVPMSESVRKAMDKCKTLSTKTSKVSAEQVKTKLAGAGKLDELKARLAQMKETKEKLKVPAPKLEKFDKSKVEVETPKETKPPVPAYEKFHSLAQPSAPTLTLPYKYQLLVEQFRGMDTVVSMLHNRSEICTFSKLKAAVQEFNKRNFELQHVGQIKTVYPAAYELRREKGLPTYGGNSRSSDYQLTVEANLDDQGTKKGVRSNFTASQLLTRRGRFHSSLVQIVKQHHKKFLASLSRPLSIPDSKITRWHPRFPLDQVADIDPSPLPQPPNVQKLQTASDVLQRARGKVAPAVVKALQATIKESEKSATVIPPPSVPTPSSNTVSTSGAFKGIPQSLLEKIRAKEAANTTSALMQDPKEEKRTVMIKRLPDIMRIMRSHFVTEKKPSLPIDSVIQKVIDSYRTCIAPGDVEPHINLCLELVPEWITAIQIKKGKYLKIDKNLDLHVITDKINNIAKARK